MKIKKIAFPVDLAGSSHRIARTVRSTAEKYGAELHLIDVVETFRGYDTFFIPHRSLDLMDTENRALAKRELQEFAEKYFEDFPRINLAVLHGKPVEQIQKYIAEQQIDMVIVAGYARSFFERTIFGKVAERIARTSSVPVEVINPFETEDTPIPTPVAASVTAVQSPGP